VTAQPPRTLADLLKVRDPLAMVEAARAYIQQREKAIDEALDVRDRGIRALVDKYGPAATAKMTGYSLSTVKTARKPGRRKGKP
jgi:hypothetical protein